ncbi:MAG: hypothetical protein ACW96X_07030 [Promethearchaeota archaeon]|jgi:hypothetical protein
MNEVKHGEDNKEEPSERNKQRQKRKRMTQGQMIQEALGLNPMVIEEVEKKLFIVRFLDFFAEDTLEFIFKGRIMEQNVSRLASYMDVIQIEREEEKLIKQSFESKNIINVIEDVKNKAEEFAVSKGIKTNVNKRLRRLTLFITLPLFGLLTILTFFPINLYFVFFPILCVVCMMPQFVRGRVVKNWNRFKEQNKEQIYAEHRDDIMILKSFAGELLNNIRSRLLELEVPLQLIKFSLFSRDYENLNLLSSQKVREFTQYLYTFEYPSGMEEFPIPEKLQRYQQPVLQEKHTEKPEKNFIVLTEMKGKDGIITSFTPTLKDIVADRINIMLNASEFSKPPNKFKTIIPNYSEKMAIYCVCGEKVKIENVQICNWKNQFKFYLFEAAECNCGESIYALSLMDESTEIPEELKDIFLS